MNRKKDDQCYDLEQMEKWLENYFLDPLTSYCDMTQFRIDLYETEKDWIVEAVLDDFKSAELSVKVEDMKLIITARKQTLSTNIKKIRTIDFPFPIKNQKVCAFFQNGILEIFISKIDKGAGNNRFITLP
ncbi:Hsp20/alpha crystallin family protein [Bacillus salipaludis]|uniref:Hsp20/alpha crystallin family protein n=1 Tax=Bacillus salipaludis TaxID=2547811 RepID=A0A4V3ATC6_9BACI|nr:Hsp20/alpha crystallin family protein [Bacillus salipaludis]MDQ6598298.1 Hsp20/alpha crystallin family protein [Bacillus salipaludis]TDK59331.1 Hsp20/alpha crystallin family protein [Bacillus salipaludis]